MPASSRWVASTKRFLKAVRDADFPRSVHPEPFGVVADSGVLHLHHDHGFFSNCSVVLREIARSPIPVVRVDASQSFRLYSGRFSKAQWGHYFCQISSTPVRRYGEWETNLYHHHRYRDLDLRVISPIVSTYFQPAERVLGIKRALIEKYRVDPSKTLAVHYRGTDKSQEVDQVPLEEWFEIVDAELEGVSDDYRVLLQTDDYTVREKFMEKYNSRAFYFSEIPVSEKTVGVHYLVKPRHRLKFARTFLAAVHLISECRRIVTHTGNVALWTSIYRGNVEGLTQVYAHPTQLEEDHSKPLAGRP